MSIIVEHEKRRMEILVKTLDVFIDEGYENVTFQKIADRCKITRTTLYIYFKNKKEIFNYSIKTLLTKASDEIQSICSDEALGSIEKIQKIIQNIFSLLEENRRLLSVTLNYLLYLSKSKSNVEHRLLRRTVKLRHIMASLVIQGVKSGEIKNIKIKNLNDFLLSFVDTAIYRLVVLQRKTVGELRNTANLMISQLAL
ncbi:MAG: TetR/AcrR family transcriptional regulator [Treponema sp.]|nr:TetR/AcrR family transcriptional regulator [Treponema sp.]